MFTVVTFAGDIHTKDNSLVHHLVKMNCSTQILRYLRLGCDEKIPSNVHQLVKDLQVILEPLVVLDYESCALLWCDALIRVVETGQGPNGASSKIGNGSSEYSGKPYPDGHISRQGLAMDEVSSCWRDTQVVRGRFTGHPWMHESFLMTLKSYQ